MADCLGNQIRDTCLRCYFCPGGYVPNREGTQCVYATESHGGSFYVYDAATGSQWSASGGAGGAMGGGGGSGVSISGAGGSCLAAQFEADDGTCYCPAGNRVVTYGSGCEATTLRCECDEIFHISGQYCIPCPDGYVADASRHSCYPAPKNCLGDNEIYGSRSQCYACQQCQFP